MSRKPDDLDLQTIYTSAQRSTKVADLIEERRDALHNLSKSRFTTTTKPEPTLKPPDDIRISSHERKENFSHEEFINQSNQINDRYDSEIKKAMMEKMNEADYEDYTKEQLQEMTNKEAAVLAENDVDGYKKFMQEKEAQKKQHRQPEKEDRPFEQNKQDIVQDYRLDDREMEALLNDGRGYDLDLDDGDKSKNKDINKSPDKPDPSDEFE